MINDYEKRGLKMIDALNFSKALKIARIKKIPWQWQSRKVEVFL